MNLLQASCGKEHAKKLRGALKDAVKEAGLKHRVRINESGCLDQCEHAAVMVVYPEAVWYGFVHPRDAEEIVQEHLVNGRPVERLRLPMPASTRPCAPSQEVSLAK